MVLAAHEIGAARHAAASQAAAIVDAHFLTAGGRPVVVPGVDRRRLPSLGRSAPLTVVPDDVGVGLADQLRALRHEVVVGVVLDRHLAGDEGLAGREIAGDLAVEIELADLAVVKDGVGPFAQRDVDAELEALLAAILGELDGEIAAQSAGSSEEHTSEL